ncbi:MAG: 30S ribosomal protein S1 [Candidatus Puniceispirillaceae bacterium]|nr:30S ribosomal protein S1 [Alphaproteobacteria bacterium]MBT5481729.1 30S ribosomal protein S1 [Alphaproteobacteria bacterium]MDA7775867.1 30S ribosomal protein S1 [Alphaproteobacteria bacterium]MDA8881911.1 30S ribosomal protein S1 [Alphaproteobacteria bacterium]MDG1029201.1 30S ribosomal protein S1 [Alphaproteobacteria bacterium]
MSTPTAADAATENFADLLAESFAENTAIEGSVVKGTVVGVSDDYVTIDVGLKSEGRVPLKEFAAPGQDAEIQVGDSVEVYVERMEDREGAAMLSREKARREEAWILLENAFEAQERVTGVIFGRVKGGFTVDLSGATAFLPGSQVDIRPIHDVGPLMGTPQPFQILKIDRRRGNIVVSRRAVLEESRAEARSELVSNLQEGQILQGIVKNITDYGAFVDLGGVDGLLHVTDIAWKRINHPSEALQVGQTVDVQVIRFNPETQRISLGMKQLLSDPWENATEKFAVGVKMEGRVTNITDYGAFVELDEGVEGLVHVSEMSWTKKNVHPGKIVSTSQQIEVMVLDVDLVKRRISLGLKQCMANPWEAFRETHEVGTIIEGEVRNITEFGIFVGLSEEIDGLVHLSDISWETTGEAAMEGFEKGAKIQAKILEIDLEKERISLGIKQLTEDPYAGEAEKVRKGDVVTCTITAVVEQGLEVRVGENLSGFIRRADLSRERGEQRTERFAVDEKIDAVITQVDRKTHNLTLSIKAREVEEEKKAMADFGSSDSGASLGDILSAAMAKKDDGSE